MEHTTTVLSNVRKNRGRPHLPGDPRHERVEVERSSPPRSARPFGTFRDEIVNVLVAWV
jgi:hypothetical protein